MTITNERLAELHDGAMPSPRETLELVRLALLAEVLGEEVKAWRRWYDCATGVNLRIINKSLAATDAEERGEA